MFPLSHSLAHRLKNTISKEGLENPFPFPTSLRILFYRRVDRSFLFLKLIENIILEGVFFPSKWFALWKIFSMGKGYMIFNLDGMTSKSYFNKCPMTFLPRNPLENNILEEYSTESSIFSASLRILCFIGRVY